jgi:hypothetical protein
MKEVGFIVIGLMFTLHSHCQINRGECVSVKFPIEQLAYSSEWTFSSDSLYVFLGEGFLNDELEFFLNDESVWLNESLTSDPVGGCCSYRSEGLMNKIESVGFLFNKLGSVRLEGPFVSNLISLHCSEDTLFINLRNTPPKPGD